MYKNSFLNVFSNNINRDDKLDGRPLCQVGAGSGGCTLTVHSLVQDKIISYRFTDGGGWGKPNAP
jgi:hypothetical protein